MEVNVTSTYQPHDDLEEIRVKEGGREVSVLAGCNRNGIEFFYYRITKWHQPFDADPFTEEDRTRLAAAIYDHFTARGRRVGIDHRRFCPRCNEILEGSESKDWPGATCDFCGREVDRFGNLVSD